MDYSLLKREILVSLRGQQSQLLLSQKLGFKFNQVGKWESGAKRIKWTEFCNLCAVLNVDLKKHLRDVFLFMDEDAADAVKVITLLKNFYSLLSLEDIAAKLSCHVSVVRRWFSGAVVPDLESFLALMDLRSHLLPTFVARLTDINQISSLRDLFYEQERARLQESMVPTLIAVELCVGLQDYKDLSVHSDEFIAERTSLPLRLVRAHLKSLIANGHLKWVDGKYQHHYLLANLHGDPASIARMRHYWSERSLLRFQTPNGQPTNKKQRPNFQACMVASISKAGMKKISERMHLCFEEIVQIINSDKTPDEEIRVILMDVFSPDDVPENQISSEKSAVPHSPEAKTLQVLEREPQ